MQIMKHRTVYVLYPWLFLETQVLLKDGRTIYAILSVNSKGRKVVAGEDEHWLYTAPSDEIDFDLQEDYLAEVSSFEEKEILNAMISMWNKNPVFFNDFTWNECT